MESLYLQTLQYLGYNDTRGYGNLLDVTNSSVSGKKAHITDRLKRFIPKVTSVYFSENTPLVYLADLSVGTNNKQVVNLHRDIWNDIHAPISILVCDGWIRVYDNWGTPTNDPTGADDEATRLIGKFQEVATLLKDLPVLQRKYLDSGSYINDRLRDRFKVDTRCDQTLIKNLKETYKALIQRDLGKKPAHLLLLRSILLLHLEHRGILNEVFYKKFNNKIKLTEIYRDYDLTMKEFLPFISNPNCFNGDLIPLSDEEKQQIKPEHLSTLANFLDGNVEMDSGQMKLWSLYKFDIIPIQMISIMYEQLLHLSDNEKASSSGVYYTPYPVVELMLNEVLPYPDKVEKDENQKIQYKKILDPTCGSGIFLVESFRRLVYYWLENNPSREITLDDLTDLLTKYIFGIDEDINAIRISCFSLYLAILDFLGDVKFEEIHFPKLVSESTKKTANLTRSDAFDAGLVNQYREGFDLVVGNPPWGGKENLKPLITGYLDKNERPETTELANAFTWLFADFSRSSVSILIPGTAFFNKGEKYEEFRKELFNNNNVKVLFNLFQLKSAKRKDLKFSQPPMAVIFDKTKTTKTESRTALITPICLSETTEDPSLLIDPSNIRYLTSWQVPDETLLKVYSFGDWRSHRLINRLCNSDYILKKYIESQRNRKGRIRRNIDTDKLFWSGVGYTQQEKINPEEEISKTARKIVEYENIDTDNMERYVIKSKHCRKKNDTKFPKHDRFSRTRELELYLGPKILIKGSTQNIRITAAFTEKDCSFNKRASGIHSHQNDKELLKALNIYFCSSLASFTIFMKSRLGVSKNKETMEAIDWIELPVKMIFTEENKRILASKYDEYRANLSKGCLKDFEQECDELIFDIFKLTYSERILVKDLLDNKIKYYLNPGKKFEPEHVTVGDLKKYTEALMYIMGKNFSSGKNFIKSEIYEPSIDLPLAMVSFELTSEKSEKGKTQVFESTQFEEFLKKLDKRLLTQEGINIFRRRHFMYFDHKKVYIIKPNHRFYWLQSEGFHDADEIVAKSIEGKLNAN